MWYFLEIFRRGRSIKIILYDVNKVTSHHVLEVTRPLRVIKKLAISKNVTKIKRIFRKKIVVPTYCFYDQSLLIPLTCQKYLLIKNARYLSFLTYISRRVVCLVLSLPMAILGKLMIHDDWRCRYSYPVMYIGQSCNWITCFLL